MESTFRRWVVVAGVALALGSCPACSLPCTAIGALGGLSITVEGGPVSATERLELTTCTDAGCTTTDVALGPGSTMVSETCTPDGSCSAVSAPDGTLQGFAERTLPEEEIDAEVTLHHRDGSTSVHAATVLPATVHPNGERCGGGAVQGGLVLDDAGLRAA